MSAAPAEAGHDRQKKDHARRISHARHFACRTHPTQQPAGPSLVRSDLGVPLAEYVPSSRFQTSALPHSCKAGANLNDTGPNNDRATAHPRRSANTLKQRIGGARRDRTDDLMLAKHALSQLSYGPTYRRAGPDRQIMVGLGRLERPTSPLSGVRSNHLSYRPKTSTRTQTVESAGQPHAQRDTADHADVRK